MSHSAEWSFSRQMINHVDFLIIYFFNNRLCFSQPANYNLEIKSRLQLINFINFYFPMLNFNSQYRKLRFLGCQIVWSQQEF